MTEERCDCENCRRLSDREYREARESFTIELEARDIHSLLDAMRFVLMKTNQEAHIYDWAMHVVSKIGSQTIGEDPFAAMESDDYNSVLMEGLMSLGTTAMQGMLDLANDGDEELTKKLGAMIGNIEAQQIKEERES